MNYYAVFHAKNRDTNHDLIKVIAISYCENKIIDAKVILLSQFESELGEKRSHKNSRNRTSKLTNTEDAISLIDENHSTDNPITVIYVAKNLRNVPSLPLSTVDVSLKHRLKVLYMDAFNDT